MLRRLISVLGGTLAAATAVYAGPQTYATKVQTFRAGVVILNNSIPGGSSVLSGQPYAFPASAGPFALYNFDANASVKPIGWSLVNPFAPSRVTSAIATRWGNLGSATPNVGDRISKKNAPYWEVNLANLSDAQLGNYDFLLVNPAGPITLSPQESLKLRRFVDRGGVLWIDPTGATANGGINGGNAFDIGNNFPAPFGLINDATLGNPQSDFSHPLLSKPFGFTTSDMSLLNAPVSPGSYDITSLVGAFGGGVSLFEALVGDSLRIQTVAKINGGATIGVMSIGSGFVVVTSRGESLKLNRVGTLKPPAGFKNAANNDYAAIQSGLRTDGIASAKLMVNMLSMLSQFRQQAGDAHKSGGSAVDIGPPLLVRTKAPVSTTETKDSNNNPYPYGAVVYGGLVIVTNNALGRLEAYRENPNSLLSGSGDPGESLGGNPGNNPGSGFDMVWFSAPLTSGKTPMSSPVLADLPLSPSGVAVLVTDRDGAVHAYNPVVRTANGGLDTSARTDLFGSNGLAAPNSPVPVGVPAPPTVFEGMAYVSDTVAGAGGTGNGGAIWVIDLQGARVMQTGTQFWTMGGQIAGQPQQSFQAPPFAASPTVGYIPIQDNSGGVDKVLYAPIAGDPASQSAPGFVSLWLGAKGEKPVSVDSNGSMLTINTRANQQGGLPIYLPTGANGDSQGFHITVLDGNGNPLPSSTTAGYFTASSLSESAGVITISLTGSGSGAFPSGGPYPQVRIDYTIDWGATGSDGSNLASVERGRIQLPDQPGTVTRFLTGPAVLSPAGTLYVAATGGGTAGLFGFQEQGRGNFVCTNRFELYPKYQFVTQGAGNDTEQPVVGDNDVIATKMVPQFLFQQFTSFAIIGAPSIRNGQVYISVDASKGANVPHNTILMAFQSEPAQPQFSIDSLPDGSVLVQADIVRSSNVGTTGIADVSSILPTSSYTYDPNTHLLQIENLMNVPKGQIQQCLSLSQRVYVRRPGQPDVAIDPDLQSGASTWSPLLWYTVLNGQEATTGPLVTGNSVFVGGSSRIRGILNGVNPLLAPLEGIMYAFSASISPNDPDFVSSIAIPNGLGTGTAMVNTDSAFPRWNKQLQQLTIDTSGNFAGNPDVLWPQYAGSGSVQDFLIRLNQTILKGNTQVNGIAGGEGVLIAQGDVNMYTFDRADFLVADQGRIGTYDPSGNPIWSTTSYVDTGSGPAGGAGNVHPLVRPTRAYRVNGSDYLVVDTGANSVVQMNQAGFQVRALTNFLLDPNYKPTGYGPNEPLQLSAPRDALTFTTLETVPATGSVTFGDGELPTGYEYWVHYLIADTGNHRLIELIDRYAFDPTTLQLMSPVTVNGVPQLGVLYWHSPPVVSGKRFDYNGVTRSVIQTPGGTPRFVYVTTVASTLPTQADLGIVNGTGLRQTSAGGAGGVIIFDPAQPGPLVFNQFDVPAIGANLLWTENPSSGLGAFNGTAARPASSIYLSNITALSTYLTNSGTVNNPQALIQIMVSTDSGVYEATYSPNAGGPPPSSLSVDWMMPNEVFRVMRRDSMDNPLVSNPRALHAVFAERVSADDVIIVNGYYGTTRGNSPYNGEVLEIDGSTFSTSTLNLGFSSGSITYELPPVLGTRGLVLPVFADRR